MTYRTVLLGLCVTAAAAVAGCDSDEVYLYHPYVTTGGATYSGVLYGHEPVLGPRSKRLEIYTGRYAAPYWGRYDHHRPRYGYHYRPHHRRYYGHHYGARRYRSGPMGRYGRHR